MEINLNKRNYPPEAGIRVPATEIVRLVADLCERVGMPRADGERMGGILAENDQRCVFSHGTRRFPGYLEMIEQGRVNPTPEIRTVSESPGSLVLDGDGGMGYFPCYQGTERIIEKARQCGVAALTTHNHFHFGAAGNYVRQAIARDCMGISVSSSRGYARPESMIYSQAGGSPVSVGFPAGEQPPLILDMGSHILHFDEELFARIPSSFLKAMGVGVVVRVLGGIFAGIYRPEFQPPQSRWESNQGSFIVVVDVSHFMPVEELKAEMDRFIGDARNLQPLPGMEQAELAGGLEWAWERENREKGIPYSDEHRQLLQETADRRGVVTHFDRYEDTRF